MLTLGRSPRPAADLLRREDYATPRNPLDIKGAGESDVIGVGAPSHCRRSDANCPVAAPIVVFATLKPICGPNLLSVYLPP